MVLKLWMGNLPCCNVNSKHSHHPAELHRYLHCDDMYYMVVKTADIDSCHLIIWKSLFVPPLARVPRSHHGKKIQKNTSYTGSRSLVLKVIASHVN